MPPTGAAGGAPFGPEERSMSTSSSESSSLLGPDPMHVGTYRSILGLPSGEPLVEERDIDVNHSKSSRLIRHEWSMIAHNVELKYTDAELKLRQDLVANKMRWYGDWRKDLWCFLRNNNPVVSMCFSHPLHPVTRKERLFAYFLMALNALYCASAISEAKDCISCSGDPCNGGGSTCASDAHMVDPAGIVPPGQYGWIVDHFCCTCQRVGIMLFLRRLGSYGGSIYAVVSNCLVTIVIFQSMMCACLQQLDPRRRELGKMIGFLIVGAIAAALLGLAPLLVYYTYMRNNLMSLLGAFVVGKLGAWVFVTVLNVCAFTVMWKAEGVSAASGRQLWARHFHVTAEDYNAFVASS